MPLSRGMTRFPDEAMTLRASFLFASAGRLKMRDVRPGFGLWEREPGPVLPTYSDGVAAFNQADRGRRFRLRWERG